MKIIHISDTHGGFPVLPERESDDEIVIHSGDWLPDSKNIGVEPSDLSNLKFQRNWFGERAKRMKDWLSGRPFFLSRGNHDWYAHSIRDMRSRGVDAYDITFHYAEYNGIRLHGFPYIPFRYGRFNYELSLTQMSEQMSGLNSKFFENGIPDILVAHCPPFGILDLDGNEHDGNKILNEYLDNHWKQTNLKWLLCGHVHKSHGITNYSGINISQAATKVHVFEI